MSARRREARYLLIACDTTISINHPEERWKAVFFQILMRVRKGTFIVSPQDKEYITHIYISIYSLVYSNLAYSLVERSPPFLPYSHLD